MINQRSSASIWAMLVGTLVAASAAAQPVQKEVANIAFTGEITAMDAKAKTVNVTGANGEKGVFLIDAKETTIMSGSQKVAFSGLHVGDWIEIDGDKRKGQKVATYIEVVEGSSEDAPAGPAMATRAGATITVGHNSLTPAVVTIGSGQSVTFHNVDKMPGGHTVVSNDGAFSSPPLDKDQSWSHAFDVPGTYTVGIKEHPGTEALIVVEALE
jgi:plastocyanin